MQLGYNTNGFSNHHSIQAIELLAELGYQSIALTIDHHCLNPMADNSHRERKEMKSLLADLKLNSVIETGARFLLNSKQKHEPTLMSAGNIDRRLDFYKYCIDVAAEFGSDCVSIWSGVLHDQLSDEAALERLANHLRPILKYAEQAGVPIGFEPEPGMFIDTTSSYQRLRQWVDSPFLKMTMDVGHLYCLHEIPIADYLHRFSDQIVNIHIEDMKAGVHEHLMFGEGEMSFPPIIAALQAMNYQGGVHVELSRHSHQAPIAAKQALDFLSPLIQSSTNSMR